MSSPKANRKGGDSENCSKVKATSFHYRQAKSGVDKLTIPAAPLEVLSRSRAGVIALADLGKERKFTKLLVNATVQGSVGAVQLFISPEDTVEDLIAAALRKYVKEARRPVLYSAEASGFDLHYSPFSLERLNKKEKLRDLGSRNFFLCQKSTATAAVVVVAATADGGGGQQGLIHM